jgi:hypothetical protein
MTSSSIPHYLHSDGNFGSMRTDDSLSCYRRPKQLPCFWLVIVMFCPIGAQLSAMRAGHGDRAYELALSFRKIKKVEDSLITRAAHAGDVPIARDQIGWRKHEDSLLNPGRGPNLSSWVRQVKSVRYRTDSKIIIVLTGP